MTIVRSNMNKFNQSLLYFKAHNFPAELPLHLSLFLMPMCIHINKKIILQINMLSAQNSSKIRKSRIKFPQTKHKLIHRKSAIVCEISTYLSIKIK